MSYANNKRLNRKSYILSMIAGFGLVMVLNLLVITILELTIFRGATDISYSRISAALLISLWCVYVVLCVIRRLHDIGRSGWFAAFFAIPTVNIILVLLLCIPKSKKDDNKWGKLSTGIHLLGFPYKKTAKKYQKHVTEVSDQENIAVEDATAKEYILAAAKIFAIGLLAIIFILQPLIYTKPYNIAAETYSKLSDATKYLEQNSSNYKDCVYSTGFGATTAETSIMFGLGYARLSETKGLYNQYLAKVNEICQSVLNKYPAIYDEFSNLSTLADKSNLTLLDVILRNKAQSPSEFNPYSPKRLSIGGRYVVDPASLL